MFQKDIDVFLKITMRNGNISCNSSQKARFVISICLINPNTNNDCESSKLILFSPGIVITNKCIPVPSRQEDASSPVLKGKLLPSAPSPQFTQ